MGWLLGWLVPLLLGVFAVGLVLSGVFPMDPMSDYPPSDEAEAAGRTSPDRASGDGEPSGTHRMHDHAGAVVFVAFPALAFVGGALLLSRPGGLPWALLGFVLGVALLMLLGRFGREWEADGDAIGAVQRVLVVLGFAWIVTLLINLL